MTRVEFLRRKRNPQPSPLSYLVMNNAPALSDKPTQKNQNEVLDALVRQIKLGIFKSGVCQLPQSQLAAIWEFNEKLQEEEKRAALRNFSLHYRFLVMIGHGLAYAVFR